MSEMLTWERLEGLERFDGAGAPVLSLYIDLDPALQPTWLYRAEFKDLVDELSGALTKPERNALASEVERVNEFFDWLPDQPGQGLALFSCRPRNLWLAQVVPARVGNHLRFDLRPDVAGLLKLTDEYERFRVALVERDKARFFTVFAGAIEEEQSDTTVLWHLDNVVEHLSTLQRRRHVDRLIIAGPKEATSLLQGALPRVLKTRVAAIVRAGIGALPEQILEATLEVERRMAAAEEDPVANEVLETAESAGGAIGRPEGILDALWAAGARTLEESVTSMSLENLRRAS